jgi:putative two-component system response regulator
MTAGVATRPRSKATIRELLDRARQTEHDDIDSARVMVQQARVLARTLGDEQAEAEALYQLASLAHYDGHADEAFAVAVDARDLARRSGALVVEVWALNLIGIVHFAAGNRSEALACSLRALELYRTTDHRVDEGNLLNSIAAIHHALGDTDRALVTYEAALSANRQFDRPEFDAITLANMAELRAERREFILAVGLGESALELSRAHAPGFVPDVLTNLGLAYTGIGDAGRAESCFQEALLFIDDRARRGQQGNPATRMSVRLARARALISREAWREAETELRRALDLADEHGHRANQLAAHELLATTLKAQGRVAEALAHQEARFEAHCALFNEGTDVRIKTLQIAHDTEQARQQAEILRLRTSELEELVRGRTHELETFQLEAFERLAVRAEHRDSDTAQHTTRVGDLAAEVAHKLGLDDEWCERLRLAARLHDIGKVGVPDSLLLKPGPLTVEEFDDMKRHTTVGAEILGGSSSELIRLAATIALSHHERWDGAGYPASLAGTAIPQAGRIVFVADVFDALTSSRVYKHAWSHADALAYVIAGRGTLFDPAVVDAFVEVVCRRLPALRQVAAESPPKMAPRPHH